MTVIIAIVQNLPQQSQLRLTLNSKGSKQKAVSLKVLDACSAISSSFCLFHDAHQPGPDYSNDRGFWDAAAVFVFIFSLTYKIIFLSGSPQDI